jgi:hypothetical protein
VSGQEWRLRAACRDADATAQAKAFGGATAQKGFIREFCRHCDVKKECLRYSVGVDSDGVYGGTTRRQRAAKGLVPHARDRWRPGRRAAA